jgi:hypothetical protein
MIIVTFHLGYHQLWNYFEPYLDLVLNDDPENVLFVSCQKFSSIILRIQEKYGKRVKIIYCVRGCDIGGQLMMFNEILKLQKQPEYVIVLHTKGNIKWREKLLLSLIGNQETIERNKKLFQDETVGMIGNKDYVFPGDLINRSTMKKICELLNIPFTKEYKFIAGTMFWVRWSIFYEVFKDKNLIDFYEELEEKYVMNFVPTMVHAWERIFGLIMAYKKFKIIGVNNILKIPSDFNWKEYLICNNDLMKLFGLDKSQTVHHFLTRGIIEKRPYRLKDIGFNPKSFIKSVYKETGILLKNHEEILNYLIRQKNISK